MALLPVAMHCCCSFATRHARQFYVNGRSHRVGGQGTEIWEELEQLTKSTAAVTDDDLHWHRKGLSADSLATYKRLKTLIDLHGSSQAERQSVLFCKGSSLALVADLLCGPAAFELVETNPNAVQHISQLANTAPALNRPLPQLDESLQLVLGVWSDAFYTAMQKYPSAAADLSSAAFAQLVLHEAKVGHAGMCCKGVGKHALPCY